MAKKPHRYAAIGSPRLVPIRFGAAGDWQINSLAGFAQMLRACAHEASLWGTSSCVECESADVKKVWGTDSPDEAQNSQT